MHMGKVDTIVYKKEGRAIITLKVPFLIFSNEILDFLNEAKDKIQNMVIFPLAGKELSIKISVDYFESGKDELQESTN